MENRLLLSVAMLESEPNDRARQADVATFDPAVGQAQLSGTISSRKDRDFFAFVAPTSGTVQPAVQANAGLIAKIEVKNFRTGEVFETESNDGKIRQCCRRRGADLHSSRPQQGQNNGWIHS